MLLRALANTVIKRRPVQALELSDNDKFDFKEGDSLKIEGVTNGGAGHIKVILRDIKKDEKEWFAYRRHVQIENPPEACIHGTDSILRVTSDLTVGSAKQCLNGTKPVYWGRYFSDLEFVGAGEYFHDKENNILNWNNIRVLPIGRYTTQVGKGKKEGNRDGLDQANDFIYSFGEDYLQSQGGEFYFFLDVEPECPLSKDYYLGWANAVKSASKKVKILPCVYLNAQDHTTSSALGLAISQGVECFGLWVANYIAYQRPNLSLPLQKFDSLQAKPRSDIPSPVLFWQYAGEIRDFDFSVSNPDIEPNEILKRLVLPPRI